MGLSKAALERHCTPLSDSVAEKNRGGHSLQEFAQLLRFEDAVKQIMGDIRNELKGKPEPEQKRILTRMLGLDSLMPYEVEATRRVYRELFGEEP